MTKKTLVIGASTSPAKYAFLAANQLLRHGNEIVLFGIEDGSIAGNPIRKDFPGPDENIDTVTLYISPKRQPQYYDALVRLKPKRIIFNPGTENPDLYKICRENGIEVEVACTLVMLSTGQY